MTRKSISSLMAAVALTTTLAFSGAAAAASKGGSVHRGTYTCYQGGLTSTGSLYWGTLKITSGNRYAITGSKGAFRRSGKKIIWKSGSLKKWKWQGEYRTSKSGGGEQQWHIDIIDRPNRIRIQCHD